MNKISRILLATNNPHKVFEIKSVLENIPQIGLYSLSDFGIFLEPDENGKTLEDNALIKAKAVYDILKLPSLSDDTGLFVDFLHGEPGVYSARYAGENATYEENCIKLLANLNNTADEKRTAKFVSVVCFYVNASEYYFFEGVCPGKIIKEKRGEKGFGYDPVFVPDAMNKTFAELGDDQKNDISHRGIALKKFRSFSDSYFLDSAKF